MAKAWQYTFIFIVFAQSHAHAGEVIDPTRDEMQKHYSEQNIFDFSLFAGIPIGHIIPERNKISFTVGGEYLKATIVPPINFYSNINSSLTIQGINATPFVAFSNDKFGMGFAGELGQYKSTYVNEYKDSSFFMGQTGNLVYSGLGVYGYFMPNFSLLSKTITPNIVTGIKQLYAIHDSSGSYFNKNQSPNYTKYRYSIRKYEIGLDLGIKLAKRFNFIPWVNYNVIKLGEAQDGSNVPIKFFDAAFLADRELFWTLKPRLSYGLDFGFSLGKANIRMGGLFGAIANLAKGSDRIERKSFSMSLSYEL